MNADFKTPQQNDTSNKKEAFPDLKERYRLVIAARNFHYDNFNKWTTYFYVAIGAIFIGYCTLLTKDIKDDNSIKEAEMVKIALLFLGFVTSYLWYISTKGYYHWSIQFINLINHYEQNIFQFPENERVYFVHANKSTENQFFSPTRGANISTSKVAVLFSFIVTLMWGIYAFYTLLNQISTQSSCSLCKSWLLSMASLLLFFTLVIFGLLAQKYLRSNVDSMPDLKADFPKRSK